MTDEANSTPDNTLIPPQEMRAGQDDREERGLRVMDNGAVADVVTGRIVRGPALTPAHARELVTRRQEKAQAAVRRAIVAADTTHSLDKRNVYGGWSTIAAAQVELALSPDAGRASTEAAKFLGKHAGLAAEAEGQQAAASVTVSLSPAAVERLAQLLAERRGSG